MQSKMGVSWGIELNGGEPDLTAWRMLLKSPFDPFVENIKDERGAYLVLISSTFQSLTTSSEVHAAAKPLLKTLNVAMAKNADADPVTGGAVVEFTSTGPPRKHYVVEAELVAMRTRVGVFALAVTDAEGNVVEPKPTPSRAQEWMRAAALVPDIGAALRYLEGKPGWVELYKAYEAVKAMPSGGLSNTEIKRFTHTANTEGRHHPSNKMKSPNRPMELWEARALITQWVSAAIDDLLSKNPLPPAAGPL